VINSNLGLIFYCFRDIASFPLKRTFLLSLFNREFENVSIALDCWNFARREPQQRVN